MIKKNKNIFNRRKMFRATLRYATLGLLGSGAVFQYFKKRNLLRHGKCINQKICRHCRIFENCSRPEALSAKVVLGESTNA